MACISRCPARTGVETGSHKSNNFALLPVDRNLVSPMVEVAVLLGKWEGEPGGPAYRARVMSEANRVTAADMALINPARYQVISAGPRRDKLRGAQLGYPWLPPSVASNRSDAGQSR